MLNTELSDDMATDSGVFGQLQPRHIPTYNLALVGQTLEALISCRSLAHRTLLSPIRRSMSAHSKSLGHNIFISVKPAKACLEVKENK